MENSKLCMYVSNVELGMIVGNSNLFMWLIANQMKSFNNECLLANKQVYFYWVSFYEIYPIPLNFKVIKFMSLFTPSTPSVLEIYNNVTR